jgi:hypothetical protein
VSATAKVKITYLQTDFFINRLGPDEKNEKGNLELLTRIQF